MLYFLFLLPLLIAYAAPEPAALIPFPPHTLRALAPSSTATLPVQIDHDLHPLVLVSTIDGALHALERSTGKEKWVLEGDPLVGGKMKGGVEEYIVEPLSGSLYVHEDKDGEMRMRKLPLSVDQLIELSPFTFPESPTQIFTGSKHTSLMSVDLRTGEQVDCFSPTANLSQYDGSSVCDDLDDLERRGSSQRDTLFIGRTDYRLTIHSPSSSQGLSTYTSAAYPAEKKSAPAVQEISYSTYTPNAYNRPLAESWVKAGVAHQSWGPDNEEPRIRIELGFNGKALGVKPGGGLIWNRELEHIGVGVYEILIPRENPLGAPILVPQPPAHLPALFPGQNDPRAFNIHDAPPSTYIATLPECLTLPSSNTTSGNATAGNKDTKPLHFALSSSSYPLINFARPPPPGHLSDGLFYNADDGDSSDLDHSRGRGLLSGLIDPPREHETIDPPFIERQAGPAKNGWWRWVVALGMLLILLGGVMVRFGRGKGSVPGSVESKVDEKMPLLAVPVHEVRLEGKEEEEEEDVLPVVKSVPVVRIQEPSSTPEDSPPRSEGTPETHQTATPPPKKKSTRRCVRGKKKKPDATTTATAAGLTAEERDGENEDEDHEKDKEDFSPRATPKGGNKPLPELPRELSSTDLLDYDQDKERLAISDTIIGFGSHGTVVLKGTWGGRPVAVKRLLSDFTRLASQEVKLLQASDDHPNVIRYYCQEKRDNFLYIALDLCQASLADLIESPEKHRELADQLDRKRALMEVTKGLKHLHGMKIIHRDIKPQNVLVSQTPSGLRILVSDFGLARRLGQDQSSFAPTANNLAGSLGWRAPECIRGVVRLNEGFDASSSVGSSGGIANAEDGVARSRLTKAVDLFALGCLYFWVLLSGEHPFGETYNRESNIVKGEAVNMGMLSLLGEEREEVEDLVKRLLSTEPDARPSTSECLTHPIFWPAAKRLGFLCDASDRFEIMQTEPAEPTLVLLEQGAQSVVGKDWYSRLDKTFTGSLGKYRKYKGGSVRDMLRAMRNKKHHYQDLEPAVQKHLGALPAGFLLYFSSRYPKLLMHVYRTVKESELREESMFEGCFQEAV
ncbi:serine/threonine-protein kinase/endoribonuclease IRE1 [Cryptococcus neoformans]|nr:serine/threonine-protein kinase/endoribonuclease IRE1 [Cryptococcus neoformans var. grubii]